MPKSTGATATEAARKPSPAELTRARTAFQRGVGFASRGNYAAAAQRFREALAIHEAPAVKYNLASALFELKAYGEAYALVQAVLQDPETPGEVRARARQLEPSLHPHVARLTVLVSGDSADVTVRVDDSELPPELVGVERTVTPGAHAVVAERAGIALSERQVEVALGTAALVELNLTVAPRQVAASALPQDGGTQAAAEARSEKQRKRRLWILVGASVLAAGAAAGLTTYALTK